MHLNKAISLSPESIDNFRKWLIESGRSSQTVKAYSTDLEVLLTDVGMKEIPAERFEEVGQRWLTHYREIVAPKTTGRRLTSLRRFAVWAEWGPLFANYSAPTPVKGTPHPLPEGIAGVKAMIAACYDDKHAALIALCGLCGCRVAEALAVKPSDFDLHQMKLTIRGKGDKQRIVPVSTYAWEVLQKPVTRAFVAGDAPVVGLKDRFARALITAVGVRADISRRVSSHDLRATFGTEVYNKTKDIRLVQDLLGHYSSAQTEVYIGVSDAAKRNGVEL